MNTSMEVDMDGFWHNNEMSDSDKSDGIIINRIISQSDTEYTFSTASDSNN